MPSCQHFPSLQVIFSLISILSMAEPQEVIGLIGQTCFDAKIWEKNLGPPLVLVQESPYYDEKFTSYFLRELCVARMQGKVLSC